jgi:hypothetical protein
MRFHYSLASLQGLAIYHTGSGPIGAIIVGLIAGTITLIAGQIALMTLRSPFVRAGIALLFAVPAATAGYHALGVAHIGIPAEGWRQAMALLGAIVVGGHSLDAHDAFCAAPGCPTWHYRCRDSLDPLTWLPGRAELPPCVISRAAGADFEPMHDHSSAARRSASIALRRGHCPARREPSGHGVTSCRDFSAAHLHARVSFPSPDAGGLLCGLLDCRHLILLSAVGAARVTWPLMA